MKIIIKTNIKINIKTTKKEFNVAYPLGINTGPQEMLLPHLVTWNLDR